MKPAGIVLGLILLVFGRKLFWLFDAVTGFLVGMAVSSMVLRHQPQWVVLCIALGAGLLGAFLAVFAERVAFAFAGIYAGAYLALSASQSLGGDGNKILWVVLGGAVGAVFAALIMDWAIIILSCLVGTWAIVRALPLGQSAGLAVFVVLVITGGFLQRRLMSRLHMD